MRLLDRHLLRAAVGPFFFGLFTITFLLMIDVLFRYVDMFVSKGVPFAVATKVLVLSLGYTLALSVPMSVLIAAPVRGHPRVRHPGAGENSSGCPATGASGGSRLPSRPWPATLPDNRQKCTTGRSARCSRASPASTTG